MICPKCGQDNPVGSTNCSQCGTLLVSPAAPVSGAPVSFWDPVSGNLTPDNLAQITESDIKLKDKYQKYQAKPKRALNNLIMVVSLSTVLVIVLLIVSYFLYQAGSTNGNGDARIFALAILGIIPASAYYMRIKMLQEDMVELMVANRFGWYYSPAKDTGKWNFLRQDYPEVFNLGNGGQYINNEFWGQVDKRDFWLGCFVYLVRRGRSAKQYKNTVQSFRLSHPAAVNFSLVPMTDVGKIASVFETNKITTESNDFNKLFHIEFHGDRGIIGADIFEVLSPEVQANLIDFNAKYRKVRLAIHGDMVMMSFFGDLPVKYTNFLKSMNLDERDAAAVEGCIRDSVLLAEKILPCLDRMRA